MGLSAPGLLPFVLLTSIPAIIHILSRIRLKRAEFPSLMLLTTAKKERFSWLRIKELLLLIFRTLALLFLLLALARPFLKHKLPGLGSGRDLVVVLDDSYSMGYSDRWASAVSVTKNLLRSLGPSRRAALLLTSESTSDTAGITLSPPQFLLTRLDSLKPSFSAAVLEPALRRAAELAGPVRGEIAVVFDRQAHALPDTWRPPVDVAASCYVVGSPGFENAGVTGVRTEDPFPVTGRAVRIKADFRNYSAQTVTRTAMLMLDGRREEKAVSLGPGATASVVFDAASADSGFHVAKVELRSDSLAADDTRWLVFRQPRRLRLLVVESPAAPARYVVNALGSDSASLFDAAVISASGFSSLDPRRFDAVVLTDAAALGRADWTRLSYYLQSGGSALVMAGRAPADSVVLEGRLRFHSSVLGTGFLTVARIDTTHPALAGLGRTDLGAARFTSAVRLDRIGDRALAELTDGSPLIVEGYDGRLVAWAFSAAPDYTDLVYKAAFVPLLHRTVLGLAGAQLRMQYAVGDTIRLGIAGLNAVPVVSPSGRFQLTPETGTGRPQAVVTRTALPGIYEVGRTPVAVNVAPVEGDIGTASDADLARLGFSLRSGTGGATSDLAPLLLLLAAAAFAAELLLLVF
jgi:hypothetical protein